MKKLLREAKYVHKHFRLKRVYGCNLLRLLVVAHIGTFYNCGGMLRDQTSPNFDQISMFSQTNMGDNEQQAMDDHTPFLFILDDTI